jgi:hypothetical protein
MDPKDPYRELSLSDRLEVLAFEARLAGLPVSLIAAVWEGFRLPTWSVACAG